MSHFLLTAGLLAATSLASFTVAPTHEPLSKAATLRTVPYAGIYAYGKAGQPTGRLTVYSESDSTIVFYLDLDTGAPAHNNGALLQRAVVRGQVATCTFDGGYAPSKDCQLTITFQPRAAVLHTHTGRDACGFGQGVRANGTFPRRSAAVPQSFRDGNGKVVLFKNTKLAMGSPN